MNLLLKLNVSFIILFKLHHHKNVTSDKKTMREEETVFACVKEREREREREGKKVREGERERGPGGQRESM
jgi:hypothetical protein